MPDPISWAAEAPYLALFALIGYIFGSIPFGLVLSHLAGLGDIRKIGSGNIGATNVLRSGKKSLALLTVILDAFKAVVPIMLAHKFGSPDAAICAAFGAFIGHLFPIWLKFKGGKGVATYLGITLAFAPLITLCFAVVWILSALLFRFSSLAALLATLACPIAAYWFGHFQLAELLALLSLLAWIKHHQNIGRLLSGTESKIGGSKS